MDTQACAKSNAFERDWWSQRKKMETDSWTDIEQEKKDWKKLHFLLMQTKEENNQDCSFCINYNEDLECGE